MPNRLDYLPIWYGLSKVGVVTALINNQLTGAALAHCLNISGAAHVHRRRGDRAGVRGRASDKLGHATPRMDARRGARRPARPDPGAEELQPAAPRPRRAATASTRQRHRALHLHLRHHRPAQGRAITHMRAQLYMRGFAGATGAKPDDRIYVTLPLYHATGGLCAHGRGAAERRLGGAAQARSPPATSGATCAAEGCTMFVYIGELCRYLVNQPERPSETRAQAAPGLRQRPAAGRLGDAEAAASASREMLEFYGSTEGNVSMFNFDGKRGRHRPRARLPAQAASTSAWSSSTWRPRRRCAGRTACASRPAPGEVGECLGQIGSDARTDYAGYADKAASEKKVLHDVFEHGRRLVRHRRPDDARTPTAISISSTASATPSAGRARTSPPARWPSALARLPGVKEANVYGVKVGEHGRPRRHGRPGRRRRTSTSKAFGARSIAEQLPAYAQPVFLRILPGDRGHRHLQVPQDRPGRRRLRPGRGQGPALRPRRARATRR